MKIVNEKPPIWDEIIAAGMKPSDNAIYTYGDTIYNPGGIVVTPDLYVHEQVHSKQQGNDPLKWWIRYVGDILWRIQQEVEAYAAQYNFLFKTTKDRNRRNDILIEMGAILSGPTYGKQISKKGAMLLIKNKADVK